MIYKKPRNIENKELSFLKEFMDSSFFANINENHKGEVSIIQEPYTGYGYADLVCIIWDQSIRNRWPDKRNQLDITDIKILHHLYNVKILKENIEIAEELGFSLSKTNKSIRKLLEAELLTVNKQNKIKIKLIKEIFFIKEIISIEAKLHNWKKALEQSVNNTYFSSQSYALFPGKIITKRLLDEYINTDVGIISFEKSYKIIKKPKRQTIPSSLSSWFFNEYIGRELCANFK